MDKKYLLGTTSLVAASVLAGGTALAEAKPLNLSLSGFYGFDVHFADEDQEGTRDNAGIKTNQDAEINFNMRGEMDNGLKIGGRIELEASNGGDQIDQHWLTLEAGWGRIDVGAINSGRYNMSWSINAPNVAHGISSGVQTEYFGADPAGGQYFRRPFGSANLDASNDDQGIHYYSPRFNGFQFGGSWRPEVSTINGGGSGGSNQGTLPDENTDYTDAVDLFLHYSGDMGGVGITALAGWFTAKAPNNASGAVAAGGAFDFDDYQGYNAGVVLKVDNFRIGGMMASASEGFCNSTDADCIDAGDISTEGDVYTIGASYGSGPWAVSVTVHDGEQEDTIGIAGDTTHETWSLGASYTVGPGMRIIASYKDTEWDDESGVAANGNKGDALSIGVALGF